MMDFGGGTFRWFRMAHRTLSWQSHDARHARGTHAQREGSRPSWMIAMVFPSCTASIHGHVPAGAPGGAFHDGYGDVFLVGSIC